MGCPAALAHEETERRHLQPRPSDLEQFSRPTLAADFQKNVVDYIEQRFGAGVSTGRTAAE
jgi:hypothetical protein